MTTKNIEDITYSDKILVWNFDEGKYDYAYPLWIKKLQYTNVYNKLTFENNKTLYTINDHRIYNPNAKKFTQIMNYDNEISCVYQCLPLSIPLSLKLISKEIIVTTENKKYYNIITEYHMNLFADDILTSCRFNNLYPIDNNMKFINTSTFTSSIKFKYIDNKYIKGMRLIEQPFDKEYIIKYIQNLMNNELINSNDTL